MSTVDGRTAFGAIGSYLFFFFLPAAAALLSGTIALRRIQTSAGRLRGSFFAGVGVATGFLALLGVASAVLLPYARMLGVPIASRLGERLGLPPVQAVHAALSRTLPREPYPSLAAAEAARSGERRFEARCTLRVEPGEVKPASLCVSPAVVDVAVRILRAYEVLAREDAAPAMLDADSAQVVLERVRPATPPRPHGADLLAQELRLSTRAAPAPGSPGLFYVIGRSTSPQRAIWWANALALAARHVESSRRTAELDQELSEAEARSRAIEAELSALAERASALQGNPTTAQDRARVYERIQALEMEHADQPARLARLRRARTGLPAPIEVLQPAREAYYCD
ncbi:MAG: hypothetical protein HYZ53_00170 [Planctomycetes bacterium]|nr:hypothetical protein [Planctomycetota bacterium]